MQEKLTIPIEDDEMRALKRYSVFQRRNHRFQAAFIIRRELERLGYLEPQTHGRQREAENSAFLTEPDSASFFL